MHKTCARLTIARCGHSNALIANSDTDDPAQNKVLLRLLAWVND